MRALAAIEELGVTPLHRLSFAPLQKYRDTSYSRHPELDSGPSKNTSTFTSQSPDRARSDGDGGEPKTTKSIGDRAESAVADYLTSIGLVILARNWKTRMCEIDIVSQFNDIIYFTEVKYRKNANQGDGFAAITAQKLRQMKFAAEYYALKNKLDQSNMFLAGADVSGADFRLNDWLVEKSTS